MWRKGTPLQQVLFHSSARSFSKSSPSFGKALLFSKQGNPEEVLNIGDYQAQPKQNTQVTIKMLAAPVNMRDVWDIRGKHNKINQFPAVGGSEGVGIVSDPGSSSFKRGDWVIPYKSAFGTWRTEATCDASDLLSVRNDIPEEFAAVLSVGPSTAISLLEEFTTLEEGDVIMISAGNSLVAQTVMQLAAQRNIKVISIIRQRPELEYGHLVERMKIHGAYIVVPDDCVTSPRFAELISDLPKPKLALDCVGGKTGVEMIRALGEGGTYVSYGRASNDPVYIPTSAMIFNDIQVRSFDFQQWLSSKPQSELQARLDKLADLVKSDQLKFWVERYDLVEYRSALQQALASRDRKVVLRMYDEDSS